MTSEPTIAPATETFGPTPKRARASKKAAKPAAKKASKATATKKRVAKPASKKADRTAVKKEVRPDTKKAIVLDLLRRKEGATTSEIANATAWQNHSIRGFVSGQVTKKMGLNVESTKSKAGERTYRIAK